MTTSHYIMTMTERLTQPYSLLLDIKYCVEVQLKFSTKLQLPKRCIVQCGSCSPRGHRLGGLLQNLRVLPNSLFIVSFI